MTDMVYLMMTDTVCLMMTDKVFLMMSDMVCLMMTDVICATYLTCLQAMPKPSNPAAALAAAGMTDEDALDAAIAQSLGLSGSPDENGDFHGQASAVSCDAGATVRLLLLMLLQAAAGLISSLVLLCLLST